MLWKLTGMRVKLSNDVSAAHHFGNVSNKQSSFVWDRNSDFQSFILNYLQVVQLKYKLISSCESEEI